MKIEVDGVTYKVNFSHAQIEITGCCNMNCKHCRAVNEAPMFMSLDKIKMILDFASQNSNKEFNLVISGGEPFMHPNFLEIMKIIKDYNFNEIVITTNGSLVNEMKLKFLDDLNFKNLTIQISIDSIYSEKHDLNRRFTGAFNKAIEALKLIQKFDNLHSSVRMTINKFTINEIESMIKLLIPLNVKRLGVGSIIPTGAGAIGSQHLSPQEKEKFLYMLSDLAKKYKNNIEIVTEDPLKCIVKNNPWIPENVYDIEKVEGVFGGCTAGIDCFNVDTHYNITPCSVFDEKIISLLDYNNVEDLTKAYVTSELVKKLFQRNFEGKCQNCEHKRICGGCRATAKYFGGTYFSSDGTCWYENTEN